MTIQVFKTVLVLLLFISVMGWSFYRALKNSEDPTRLVFKWILTGGVFAFIFYVVLPTVARKDEAAAYVGIPLAAVSGLALAIIWRHALADLVSKPFESLYDGGDQKVEARPLYSKAEKLRQRNQFNEAIIEVRSELAKFPDDFAGQMLIADIYAKNSQDLQSAEIVIQKIVHQPQHSPAQITGALHSLADWHMKLAQDPESARLVLETIIERFPDSQFSQTAAQRIAHLGSVDSLLATHERPTLILKHFDPYANLQSKSVSPEPPPSDAAARAAECFKQLEQHPLDTEAREKLAAIYAHDYQRLDLAADQIEQLVAQPNRRPREVARWLNLLADFQIQIGNDIAAATASVHRIQTLFPTSAYAEQANMRLEYLRSQAKRNEVTQGVQLHSYEKDLGLKKPFPSR